MKNYYKVVFGYGPEEYIEIDESELRKAYYCFLEKKDSIFKGGAVRGAKIQAIQPDYHRAMGWNRGYRLGPDDYAELSERGVSRTHMTLLADVKAEVNHLIQAGDTSKLLLQ